MNEFITQDKLPSFGQRAKHTEDWFSEYLAEQWGKEADSLDNDEVEHNLQESTADADDPQSFSLPLAPYDRGTTTLQAGSIRLLSSALSKSDDGSSYIMILGPWGEDQIWFAPFSPFDSPATENELRTGMELEPLRTLQIWNARSAPTALLSESWFVDQAPEDVINRARQIFRALVLNLEDPAPGLLEHIGTSISHAKDPRRSWIRQQVARLDPVTQLAHFWEQIHAEPTAIKEDEGGTASDIIPFPSQITQAVSELLPVAGLTPSPPSWIKLIQALRKQLPAAAADTDHISAIIVDTGLSQLLSHWLEADDPTSFADLDLKPIRSFSCQVLVAPDPNTGALGVFKPSMDGDDAHPADGTPFLLIHKKNARSGGSGIVLEGLLKLDRPASTIHLSALSDFVIILARD